jgi:tetratricopeptide (TPR) repeat protein
MNTPDNSENSTKARLGRLLSRLLAFEFRDAWWHLLDLVEKRRAVRRLLYVIIAFTIMGIVSALWIYPWWRQRTAVGMARQWLEAGRLDHASESIQEALQVAPNQPESWKLAADLARLLGNHESALGYSKKAVELAPTNIDLTITWAADALLANHPEESDRALAALPADVLAQSAHTQRIAGELARRRAQFTEARDHFENALRIDGPNTAIDEIPLGVILLNARDSTERQRGIDLLARWSTSVEWGANALRTLLGDALLHNDHPAMLRWADALRAHPRCTLGDIPNCLRALSIADESRFSEVLAMLEKKHAIDPANIAILVSWLNQIGRSREAAEWIKTLPPALTQKPPAAVSAAESLRMQSDWSGLFSLTVDADWGRDLEALRLAYALRAARGTGHTDTARSLWTTLQTRSTTDGERTLFTADSLYAWGLQDESLALLWNAVDEPGIAINALATLARHYQVERNATGQYRAFKQLHSLRANDPDITNNYIFFATLTGNDLRQSEELAAKNHRQFPENPAYLATYALVLTTQNRPADALVLFQTASPDWKTNPVTTLAYGLTLAGTERKAEARKVLKSLIPNTLTKEESALIAKAID